MPSLILSSVFNSSLMTMTMTIVNSLANVYNHVNNDEDFSCDGYGCWYNWSLWKGAFDGRKKHICLLLLHLSSTSDYSTTSTTATTSASTPASTSDSSSTTVTTSIRAIRAQPLNFISSKGNQWIFCFTNLLKQ